MRYIVILIFLVSSILGNSQSIDLKNFEGIKARSIGPAGMSGRVTSIDVVHRQEEIIYVGTASGGLWKSTNAGISWNPIFDKEGVASIGAVSINQQNPDEIWVGTGEGNPRNSHNSGIGIYRSLDAGRTWKHMGLSKTRLIHRIIINEENPEIIYVGTLGSGWGPNPERGVFKTIDGGKTWEKILYINNETGCADLVVDPSNPNKLIAAMWEFGRKPWTFNSGGKGSGLHITYDGGTTWEKITAEDGLPKGDLGRMGVAIAASKPDVVYAYVEAKKNAFYASTDGGHTWEKRGDKNMGNRPFYYADIYVDPSNENRIFSLHSTITTSEDGGKNWSTLAGFSGFSGIHPDHHAMWIHPTKSHIMMEGNDGGLNISYDKGKTWRFVENLPLAQFYHINYDMDFPYNVYGGMQDNGSWVGPSNILKRGGIKNNDWQEVMFGDGFDVVPYPADSRYGYAMSQGGNVSWYDRKTGRNRFIKPVHPEGIDLRYNWNAAIAQDPKLDCGIYYGSQFVHYSKDCGKSWQVISPDLTTNDSSKQKQGESGGLTIDATKAENFTTIIAIAPSPVEQKVIWVGTDDGNLQLTQDGGANWVNLADRLSGCPKGSWIPQVVPSEKNAGEAFVVVNNYRRNDWTPYVYHTTDYGKKWNRIVDGNKVSGYCRTIVQDPKMEKHLWLGTDHGLYFSIDKGAKWIKWNNEFPSVNVSDLKIHPREEDLIIGTFGRAAYILDDIRPFRKLASTNGQILKDSFFVFPAPDAYDVSYRSADGSRFVADATFVGDNKPSGAQFTIWAHPDRVEKKSKDKYKIQVVNAKGDTIRTYTRTIKPGMFRTNWNLNADGQRFPNWKAPKKDADIPSGMKVLPGTYTVVFKYKDWVTKTPLTVKADPRLEGEINDPTVNRKYMHELDGYVKYATDGFTALRDAKANINRVNGMISELPDSIQKSIKEMGKTHMSKIDSLGKLYVLPVDFKGLDSFSPSLNRQLSRANFYLRSSYDGPGENALTALKLAKDEVNTTMDLVNNYLQIEWPKYEDFIDKAPIQILKRLQQIDK